jgi:hypothetical protein
MGAGAGGLPKMGQLMGAGTWAQAHAPACLLTASRRASRRRPNGLQADVRLWGRIRVANELLQQRLFDTGADE